MIKEFEAGFTKIIDEAATLNSQQLERFLSEMEAKGMPKSLISAIKAYSGENGADRLREDFKRLTGLVESVRQNMGGVSEQEAVNGLKAFMEGMEWTGRK